MSEIHVVVHLLWTCSEEHWLGRTVVSTNTTGWYCVKMVETFSSCLSTLKWTFQSIQFILSKWCPLKPVNVINIYRTWILTWIKKCLTKKDDEMIIFRFKILTVQKLNTLRLNKNLKIGRMRDFFFSQRWKKTFFLSILMYTSWRPSACCSFQKSVNSCHNRCCIWIRTKHVSNFFWIINGDVTIIKKATNWLTS